MTTNEEPKDLGKDRTTKLLEKIKPTLNENAMKVLSKRYLN